MGVAPGTRIYAVKVLNSLGTGLVSDIICGIDWVTGNAPGLGIRVANMSIGGAGPGAPCEVDPFHFAICNSTRAGVLYTVAAGNDARDLGAFPPEEPAAFPEVLTVAAMADSDGVAGGAGGAPQCPAGAGQPDDFLATFSNYARLTTPTRLTRSPAPGVCIRSPSLNGLYETESGTSIAAPHVAGVAALCLGQAGAAGPCAGLTPPQLIDKLRRDAAEGATDANGFFGDPLHPLRGYYGFLVSAERSTRPSPPPAPAPPVAGTTNPTAKPAVRRCRGALDYAGCAVRGARKKLKRAGCRYRIRGHGRVRSTVPRAGRKTARRVLVRLSARR